jgi:hypothetical protein
MGQTVFVKYRVWSKETFIERNEVTFIIALFFRTFSVFAFRGMKVSERRKPTIAYRQKVIYHHHHHYHYLEASS